MLNVELETQRQTELIADTLRAIDLATTMANPDRTADSCHVFSAWTYKRWCRVVFHQDTNHAEATEILKVRGFDVSRPQIGPNNTAYNLTPPDNFQLSATDFVNDPL
jgi:hypothetical protein